MENLTINKEDIVVVVDSHVLAVFAEMGGKQESGGVLYGFKISDKEEYVISGCTLPQKKDLIAETSFVRKDKKHFDLIKEIWIKDKTTMYFGDWHFHPVDSVLPSNQDYLSFAKVCKESKTTSKYIINIIVAKQEFVVFVYNKKSKTKLFEFCHRFGEKSYE